MHYNTYETPDGIHLWFRLLVLRLTASSVSGWDPVQPLPQTCSHRYRSIRLNCLQIQPYTALFLTFIHLTLTFSSNISVIICGDWPLTVWDTFSFNRDYSFANSQHRVSAPRSDVDTEPLVRTASVSRFLFSPHTHQQLISSRIERSRRQCPLDIDKLIKMDEWQPRIFADGKVSSGVILLYITNIYEACNAMCCNAFWASYDVFPQTINNNRTPYEVIEPAETQTLVYLTVQHWNAALLLSCCAC